jgi:hypothetical protein
MKRPLGRLRRTREDNIKIILKKNCVNLTQLAQDTDQWPVLVNTLII